MPKPLTNLSKEQLAEQGYVATFYRDQFTYCCGGREIGGLEVYTKQRYQPDTWTKGTFIERKVYSTPYEAWKAKLPEMRTITAYPLMLNVVESDTPELAKLLREQADVIEVFKWNNPNTGNIITMFILTNGADETEKEREDDDD
jgi:hypothetical protein